MPLRSGEIGDGVLSKPDFPDDDETPWTNALDESVNHDAPSNVPTSILVVPSFVRDLMGVNCNTRR